MGWGIGFGLDRMGLLAHRMPRLMTLVTLAVLAAVAASLPHLRFDQDINRVFLSDSPLSQAHRAMEAEGPRTSTIALMAEAPHPFDPEQLSALRDLALDLELTPGVLSVASPFALRFSPNDPRYPDAPVFPATIDADTINRVAVLAEHAPQLPLLISDAADTLLITATVDLDQTPLSTATAEVAALAAPLQAETLRLAITGEDVIGLEIVKGLKADLILLNTLGLILVALAALAILRDISLTLLATLPAAAGAALTLALSVWLGFPITVVSNVIPVLVLVLGVADGVHLARYFKTAPGPQAVADTVRTIGPACALAAITTSTAFAGILVSGNAQLREFALLGALGVLAAFLVMITGFALLAQVLRPSARPVPSLSVAIATRLVRVGLYRPKATTLGAIALIALGGIGYLQTTPWFPVYQNLPTGSATHGVNDRIQAQFGGTFQAWVTVPQTGTQTENWQTLTQVVTALEGVTPPRTLLSDVSFAQWNGTPGQPPTAEQREELPQVLVDRLAPNGTTARIAVALPEPMRSPQTQAQFQTLQATALAAGASAVLGLPAIMQHEALSLIRQLSIGLLLACIAATGVIALAFRQIRLVPALLLPNTLPVLLVAASLHLLTDGQISPVSVLALTLAFGIAVDDTIHFLSRFTDARSAGQSTTDALDSATRTAGEVMVLTTLLLSCGIAVTLFSGFHPIRLFGTLLMLALWIALIVDLVLLPAVLKLKGGR